MTATETATTATVTAGAFEVLRGHTSFETALEVADYPYSFRLRTSIRYWLETAEKGAKKGETRLMTCTLNPKTGRWNKPHGGTYVSRMWLYRDHRDGHVHGWGLSFHDLPGEIARAKAAGIWGHLNEAERDELDRFGAYARRRMRDYYAERDAEVARVRAAAAAHGYGPDLYEAGGFAARGEGWMHRPTFDAALALVKAEELGEFTYPATH